MIRVERLSNPPIPFPFFPPLLVLFFLVGCLMTSFLLSTGRYLDCLLPEPGLVPQSVLPCNKTFYQCLFTYDMQFSWTSRSPHCILQFLYQKTCWSLDRDFAVFQDMQVPALYFCSFCIRRLAGLQILIVLLHFLWLKLCV